MSDAKTVFVVESGNYSDYRVVGVFTTRENAQRVSEVLGEGTIAEWPLDPAIDALNQGLVQFGVFMLRDGSTENVAKLDNISMYALVGAVEIWRRSQAPRWKGTGVQDVLSATVWAEDEEHAVKIANEHRTRLIASGEWE